MLNVGRVVGCHGGDKIVPGYGELPTGSVIEPAAAKASGAGTHSLTMV